MRTQIQVLLAMLRDPRLRRVEGAFGASVTADEAAWIAILVYAYQRGGVVETGVVGFALLLPAALLSPLAALASDRFRREAVLALGYAVQALALAATAIAIVQEAPGVAVYSAAALVHLSIAITNPTLQALLPSITRSAEDLTAANAAIGVLENLGGLLGPLCAAALLWAFGVASVFGAMAAMMFAALFSIANLRIDPGPKAERLAEIGSLSARILGGVRYLSGDADALLLVLCAASFSLLIGAIDVAVIAATGEIFGRGEHAVGYFTAAFAVGGLFGAIGTVVLIGRRRLVPALFLGGFPMGASIVGLSAAAFLPMGLLLLFICGLGYSFASVASTTLIQRTSPDRVRARVFGVYEGLQTVGLAVGALLVSVASTFLGLRGTLVGIGLLVPAALLIALRRLVAIDRAAQVPPARILASLRADPIFAPLAPPVIERLAAQASIVRAQAGSALAREGEIGDHYYRVLTGELEVRIEGRSVRELTAGDSFGEIALLYAVPRTATVTARTETTLLAVERKNFLEILTGHPQSRAEAEAVARRFLAQTPRPAQAD